MRSTSRSISATARPPTRCDIESATICISTLCCLLILSASEVRSCLKILNSSRRVATCPSKSSTFSATAFVASTCSLRSDRTTSTRYCISLASLPSTLFVDIVVLCITPFSSATSDRICSSLTITLPTAWLPAGGESRSSHPGIRSFFLRLCETCFAWLRKRLCCVWGERTRVS